jgi:hypothetical protein
MWVSRLAFDGAAQTGELQPLALMSASLIGNIPIV